METLPTTRLLFLLALTTLAVAYTVMAFGMEWRVERGQIGPGFFPRLVGAATVLGCLVAIARAAGGWWMSGRRARERPDSGEETDRPAEEQQARTDARVTVLAVGCMVVFFFVFEPLGALLSSVLFLGLLLSIVNRAHHLLNAAVSVLVPAGLYLLFEVLLDTGLPPGLVLPL